MTLIATVRSHLDSIAEVLTEVAQEYEQDGKEWQWIMCAVDNIQAARDCLDDVGAPE